MRTITFQVPAGQAVEIAAVGDYVRIKQAAVELRIEHENGDFIEAGQGDDFTFEPFGRLRVSHADGSAQQVKLTIAKGKRASSAQIGGSISLNAATLAALETIQIGNQTAQQGAFTQAQKTVTNASAQMLAANAARRYLLVQNNHATATAWVNLTGAACTAANGIKIAPGGSYIIEGYLASGAITAIGDIASNTAVVAVEG